MQVKLLRVLQEGEVRPVGATETRTVDVRILSATHRNLEEAIVSGETTVFMQETYHLEEMQVMSGLNTLPVAAVRLQGPEESTWVTSQGNGPVDAVFKAIGVE